MSPSDYGMSLARERAAWLRPSVLPRYPACSSVFTRGYEMALSKSGLERPGTLLD